MNTTETHLVGLPYVLHLVSQNLRPSGIKKISKSPEIQPTYLRTIINLIFTEVEFGS